MEATIDQVKEAKKIAQSKINLILTELAQNYKLSNLSVDVRTTQLFGDNDPKSIALGVCTIITVEI